LVSGANLINAALYDKLNFNFIRDVAPIASIIRVPHAIVVHPSLPATTVPELLAYAKANPGKVNMACGGTGNATHLTGELFKMMAGVDMVHVPRWASVRRPPRATGAGVFPHDGLVNRVRQGRQPARAGGDHGDAIGGAAGHPDRRRVRPGLRGKLGVW